MPNNDTKFQEKWYKCMDPNLMLYETWLKKCDDQTAWCDFCQIKFKVNKMGKSAIKQHAIGGKHIQKSVPDTEQNQQNHQIEELEHEEITNIDDSISKAEILWSLLCAEHDLSFLVNDHISKMFPRMFSDSATASGYKSCRTKTRYTITHGTYETFKTQLDMKLKENLFSLEIDESNKIYGKKFFVMLVKFFDSEVNKVINRFWELKVTNKCDSPALVKAITDAFADHDVPYSNLIQIMSDSPNLMRGKYEGVVTRMTQDYAPHIVDLGGCSLHHVNNAIKNATYKLHKAEYVEEFLQDLSSFFSFHVEFAEEFSQIQEELHIPKHRLIKYVVVRFLSIYSSLKRVLEQYDAIKLLFQVKIPKYHTKVANQARVIRINQRLKDNMTLPTLEFLSFFLESFQKYEKLFQRSDPTLHLLYNKQVDLYRNTLISFCNFEMIAKLGSDSELVKFDYKNKKNQLENSKITIGTKATKLTKKISEDDKKVFFFGIREFLVKVVDGLLKDLSLQNQTMADLRCLAPSNRSVTYERAIIRLAKKLPPNVRLTATEIDNLPLEWKYLVLEKISWDKYDSLILHWGKIFQMRDEVGDFKFPLITKIVKFCLSLSEANAAVERSFSQIAHIIGKDRNRILPETVKALMVTKSHIENTAPCYKQEIDQDLISNVKQAFKLYSNRSNDVDMNNNSEAGPSHEELVEENLSTEIKYQEEKMKLNNESAQKLLAEAQKFMAENTKLNTELEKLKKRQKKNQSARKGKRSRK